MQTKRIKCPQCNAVLDVKNSKNEAVKQINCPQCKAPLMVKFPPQLEPMEAETYYAPKKPAPNDGATQLSGGLDGATQLVGNISSATRLASPTTQLQARPKLLFQGREYPLDEGRNVVGRRAQTSQATVQIDSTDRYMSRQHCIITVTSLPDGSKKAVLTNFQNKNATTIDGQEITSTDAIRLTNGNSIKMGKTTVTFKQS